MHEDGSFDINLRVFTNGSKLKLWVPEELDECLVHDVVRVHEIVIVMEEGEEDAISTDFK